MILVTRPPLYCAMPVSADFGIVWINLKHTEGYLHTEVLQRENQRMSMRDFGVLSSFVFIITTRTSDSECYREKDSEVNSQTEKSIT